jgi:hypothetical protein
MDRAATAAHLNRAGEHEASAKSISELPPACGWCIVVNFYAALHLVDAYLNTKDPPIQPQSHTERERRMREFPELHGAKAYRFSQAYKRLDNHGRQVRYDMEYKVDQSEIADSVSDLATVRSYLGSKVVRALGENVPSRSV